MYILHRNPCGSLYLFICFRGGRNEQCNDEGSGALLYFLNGILSVIISYLVKNKTILLFQDLLRHLLVHQQKMYSSVCVVSRSQRLQDVQLFFYLWFRRNIDPEVYCLVSTSYLIFLLNIASSWSSLRHFYSNGNIQRKKYDLSCQKSVLGKQSSPQGFSIWRFLDLFFFFFSFSN